MEVECPHCQSTQIEPKASLSTFCRHCGQHFKIDKSRGVISQRLKDLQRISHEVGRSKGTKGVEIRQSDEASSTSQNPVPKVPEKPADQPAHPQSGAPPEQPAPGKPSEPVVRRPAHETQSFRMTRPLRSNASGSFANRHKPRPVGCFHCDGTIEVSYAAKQATCPECGETINLNDYEINRPLMEDIFTRGNVTINKLGSLECENLVCHNLKAYGNISAIIHGTGDVIIRSRATLPGGLRCKKLTVGRDALVHVLGDVRADEMEVDGEITAEAFHCLGTTHIDGHGSVNGPLVTRAVSMEDGGALNGALQIAASRPA